MTPLSTVKNEAENALGQGLPRIAAAIALLTLGLLVVRLVVRLLVRGLRRLGLDGLGERWGVGETLERVGLDRSLTKLAGKALRFWLSLIVIFAALSLLGLAFLSESLNEAVLFLPKLVIALVLVLAGVVLGGLAREHMDRVATQMDLRGPLGQIADMAIVAVFALTALAQLGVPTIFITLIGGIAAGAAALTFSLAFGLGSRDVARQISAGRYVGGAFSVGQTVTVDGKKGEIVALESASLMLETPDGRTLRVPNHVLLETIVTVHDDASSDGPEGPGASAPVGSGP